MKHRLPRALENPCRILEECQIHSKHESVAGHQIHTFSNSESLFDKNAAK